MGKQIDVLAVMDGNVRAAQNRCDTARSMKGADARRAELREQQAARAAVAELVEAAKLARAQMAHKAGCGHVRPTSEWAEHGSWNYDGCCCDIRRVDAALAPFQSGGAA